MKYLRYKNPNDKSKYIDLKMLNTYEITKSSQEVSYNDFECDFTGFTAEDLPEKYQEVELINRESSTYTEIEKQGQLIEFNMNDESYINNYVIHGNSNIVTGEQTFNVNNEKYKINLGKNLFNLNENHVTGNMSGSGVVSESEISTFELSSTGFSIGDSSSWKGVIYDNVYLESGKTYTISLEANSNAFFLANYYYNENDEFISTTTLLNNTSNRQYTFTVPNNVAYTKIVFECRNANSVIQFSNIQIERGITKTDYINYIAPIKLDEGDYIYRDEDKWFTNINNISTEIITESIVEQLDEILYKNLNIGYNTIYLEDNDELKANLEITIMKKNKYKIDTLYTGYIDSYNFNNMREIDEFTEINITLLSPMKITTLRTFIAIGTYQLKDLIQNIILSPLINDGFTLEELDISDRQITVNFLSDTIEYGLNILSNDYNFWWFIDENKKIYIKDINTMLNGKPKHIYDDTHKISGLQYLKPKIISDNYANVINFSNVRIYENSDWEYNDGEVIVDKNGLLNEQISTLKKGDQVDFKYPVDIKKENIKKSGESYIKRDEYYGIRVFGNFSNNTTFEFYIKYDVVNNNYTISNNLGFEGNEDTTKDFLLIRDSFFDNLIIGFKYNNESKNVTSIGVVMSDSALIWNINKFYNDKAINDKKNIISDTGIVELTVNMNEQWKTKQELQNIGLSYMQKNSLKLDGEVELKLDKNVFNVGDIIKINKMLFNDNYIVTKIVENFKNKNVTEYLVTCKNANITDNYIDLFRSTTEQQDENKIYQVNISHYSEEGIKETFEVVQ